MDLISAVEFETQPLVNRSEFQVLALLEAIVREMPQGFRVMAQTSLGEILRPKTCAWNAVGGDLAYRAINSKRTDFVVVDSRGLAVLAVEYQGHGHYQGNAFMRDAVKREVFRKANVAFLEIPANYEREDIKATVCGILDRHVAGRPNDTASRAARRAPHLQKRLSG
jgi:hypothetical protein